MTYVLAFIVGLPLAAELLGACLSVRDCWSLREARAAAVERLAMPLLCWGGLWWMAGVDSWPALLAALAVVAVWQVIAFYSIRILSRWGGFQTVAIDTDDEIEAIGKKKSPGDNGDWGRGEEVAGALNLGVGGSDESHTEG